MLSAYSKWPPNIFLFLSLIATRNPLSKLLALWRQAAKVAQPRTSRRQSRTARWFRTVLSSLTLAPRTPWRSRRRARSTRRRRSRWRERSGSRSRGDGRGRIENGRSRTRRRPRNGSRAQRKRPAGMKGTRRRRGRRRNVRKGRIQGRWWSRWAKRGRKTARRLKKIQATACSRRTLASTLLNPTMLWVNSRFVQLNEMHIVFAIWPETLWHSDTIFFCCSTCPF